MNPVDSNGVIGPTYYQSLVKVEKGDRVMLDDHWCGCVEEVCLPGSALARDYSCEDTGGLLILFDDGMLVLEPFGFSGYLTKLP